MDTTKSAKIAGFGQVPGPDEIARGATFRRFGELIKPVESLGRLENLAAWLAACQGQSPPQPPQRPRVVVFAGDHGIAQENVSACPAETTGQLLGSMLTGGTATDVLVTAVGATMRVVDMAVKTETAAPINDFKVRQGSGRIDIEDALSADETHAAFNAGIAVADAEVDAGADLLIPADLGVGNSTPAATIIAAITGIEPVLVVGRGSGIDDKTWMRKAAAIRDALHRTRQSSAEPVDLLRIVGGADFAAMAGFLAQAAVRRTPVLLDGLAVGAAALIAEGLAPGARSWWLATQRCPEPGYDMVLEHLDLEPVLDLHIRLGQGVGALAALPLVAMAAHLATDMATYEQAGVSPPKANTAR